MEKRNKNIINCCFCDKLLSSQGEEETKLTINKINIYKCPACERKYCSANCCTGHKEKYDCCGERNKTPYVRLDQFDQKQFLDDYFFLENVKQKLDTAHRVSTRVIELKSKKSKRKNHKRAYFKNRKNRQHAEPQEE